MPELPEVETIKNDLSKLVIGKKILDISTDSPKQLKPSILKIKKEIAGTKIIRLFRKAKVLIISLSNGLSLAVHLKMTGRLLFRKKEDPVDKWQHATFTLSGGNELRFCDLRKFGWIKLVDKNDLKKIVDDFGPEPEELNLDQFRQLLSSTKRAVKLFLMDQTKIAGIGNIYACEALNLARINPRKAANELNQHQAQRLLEALRKVVKAGVKYRGASDQYYLDALGKKGSYQEHFLVYNRKGKKCFNCRGKVKKIKLGGRGTYYCPLCQK